MRCCPSSSNARVVYAMIFAVLGGCAGSPPTSDGRVNYLISGGEPDLTDQYSSVVQVVIPTKGTCSGVLVNPQLVLAAAHCFCLPAQGELAANRTYSFTPTSTENQVPLKCSQNARIVATLYAPPDASSGTKEDVMPDYAARLAEPRNIVYDGPVRTVIHEGYTFRTDEDADITNSEMDLAAIHLSGPFQGVGFEDKLPGQEARPGEFFVAVGYGPTELQDRRWRHFGRAKIMDPALSGAADKVFAFGRPEVPLRGVKALTGDSGGPCFREDTAGHRWLSGIISYSKIIDGELITIFTSTFHHRAWINRQKDLSARTVKSP
jgi:hypothetical protein